MKLISREYYLINISNSGYFVQSFSWKFMQNHHIKAKIHVEEFWKDYDVQFLGKDLAKILPLKITWRNTTFTWRKSHDQKSHVIFTVLCLLYCVLVHDVGLKINCSKTCFWSTFICLRWTKNEFPTVWKWIKSDIRSCDH